MAATPRLCHPGFTLGFLQSVSVTSAAPLNLLSDTGLREKRRCRQVTVLSVVPAELVWWVWFGFLVLCLFLSLQYLIV